MGFIATAFSARRDSKATTRENLRGTGAIRENLAFALSGTRENLSWRCSKILIPGPSSFLLSRREDKLHDYFPLRLSFVRSPANSSAPSVFSPAFLSHRTIHLARKEPISVFVVSDLFTARKFGTIAIQRCLNIIGYWILFSLGVCMLQYILKI